MRPRFALFTCAPVVLIVAALLTHPAHAQQVTLDSVMDNTLYQSAPDNPLSNGSGPGMYCGKNGGGLFRRALMRFDIASAVPAGSTINSVTLRLQCMQAPNSTARSCSCTVSSPTGASISVASGGGGGGDIAGPGDASWFNRFEPTATMPAIPWSVAGGQFAAASSATATVNGYGAAYTWGSTPQLVADVQSWLDNPQSNFGWILRGVETSSQTARKFATREEINAAWRPKLVVDYTSSQGIAWSQRIVSGPSPRDVHAMAFDAARGATVLFGGYSTSGGVNDETWEWNGTAWTQRAVSGPSPRYIHAMAYDTGRSVTVLFGGLTGGGTPNGETWEWNGTAWTQRAVSGPSARCWHAMAYDAARGVTVLFGGRVGAASRDAETWEWNGTVWTQRAVSGPSPRYKHAMSYDAARAVTVLFGGESNSGATGETWEWDGNNWTQRVVSGPSPRSDHAMAYDAARGVTVLFGGGTSGGTSNETWEWNGTVWTQRVITSPSPRWSHRMAYDAARGATVLFGGYTISPYHNGETWELVLVAPRSPSPRIHRALRWCLGPRLPSLFP